jgi:hypothetical protein
MDAGSAGTVDEASSPLAAALLGSARPLAEAAFSPMLDNAFWLSRYGARGRKHSVEDGEFHIRYLAEALTSRDGGLLTRYAEWLRDVLVSRGMCTMHLVEHFEQLRRALRARFADDAELRFADDALTSAAWALVANSGDGESLQRAAWEALLERLTPTAPLPASGHATDAGDMGDANDAPDARAGLAGPERLPYLLSYLADALTRGAPTTWVEYVAWARTHFEKAPRRLDDALDALVSQLASVRPLPTEAMAFVEAARATPPSRRPDSGDGRETPGDAER